MSYKSGGWDMPKDAPVTGLPSGVPPEAAPFLEEVGYLAPDPVAVGDAAPDVPFFTPDGEEVRLGRLRGERPVILVFGSHTWPPFRRQSGDLERIYQTYRARAAFFVVYIQEAHPTDGWQVPSNERDGALIRRHRAFAERQAAAACCASVLNLTAPLLLDGMENAADLAYGAWPERLYVLSREGTVAYQGGKGPYGFDPAELETFLQKELRQRAAL
jgi:thyroxine 5-deiodinase